MAGPPKVDRKGRKCNIRNITFTTKDPWPRELGYNHMRQFMAKQPATIIDFVLCPEYSPEGMLHFHGTIWYTNQVHFCSMVAHWRRYFGFIQIAVTKGNSSLPWHFYCLKDQWQWNHRRINSYNVKRHIYDTHLSFTDA